MRIFVSGVGSFIGRELVRQCDGRGIAVGGIDLVDVKRPGCIARDIRDGAVADAIPRGVDAVVHLAALSRDADCRGRAKACFDANVTGTLNLAEAALARGARQFVFASSEWVYPRFAAGQEADEATPIDMADHQAEYALSKTAAEAALRIFHQRHGLAMTVLRFGIVYGPRRDNWAAVEALTNAVARDEVVRVGSLRTARRFIHVRDIAAGILATLGRGGCETFNIQGPRLVTLGEVIDTASRVLGRKPRIEETAPDAVSVRPVSSARAEAVLGWKAAIGIEDGIRDVADFLGLVRP